MFTSFFNQQHITPVGLMTEEPASYSHQLLADLYRLAVSDSSLSQLKSRATAWSDSCLSNEAQLLQ